MPKEIGDMSPIYFKVSLKGDSENKVKFVSLDVFLFIA